ncbi:hypothetical protein GGD52_003781 [Agrobacterium tumefaciens]|nr:hypothetical protein [Agrobacterium radiobacter]MBB5589160.1 hypothetical protein [Agrobacterium radiobacter]
MTVRADGTYEIDGSIVAELLVEAAKVMEGNPQLEVASIGVGGKPIPGDGKPVIGAIKAMPRLLRGLQPQWRNAWSYHWRVAGI